MEAPYVGNPPEDETPEDYISASDEKWLSHIVDIMDAGTEEVKDLKFEGDHADQIRKELAATVAKMDSLSNLAQTLIDDGTTESDLEND